MLKSEIQYKGKKKRQTAIVTSLKLVNHVIMHSCRGSVTGYAPNSSLLFSSDLRWRNFDRSVVISIVDGQNPCMYSCKRLKDILGGAMVRRF